MDKYRYFLGVPIILAIITLCWIEAVHPVQITVDIGAKDLDSGSSLSSPTATESRSDLSAQESINAKITGLWLLPILLFAGLASVYETLSMLEKLGVHAPRKTVTLFSLLILLAPWTPFVYAFVWKTAWCRTMLNDTAIFSSDFAIWLEHSGLGLIFLWFIFGSLCVILAQMKKYPGSESHGQTFRDILGGTFILFYLPVLLSFASLILLRWGVIVLGGVILLTKSGDMGAYWIGKTFGKRISKEDAERMGRLDKTGFPKHPMSPIISPKKSWEGVLGAVLLPICVAITLAIVACHQDSSFVAKQPSWLYPPRFIVFMVLSGVTLGVVGILGDLFESLFKREAGVKDSSTWLPGFGGVLDMVDSILFAAPVAFLLLWLHDILRG